MKIEITRNNLDNITYNTNIQSLTYPREYEQKIIFRSSATSIAGDNNTFINSFESWNSLYDGIKKDVSTCIVLCLDDDMFSCIKICAPQIDENDDALKSHFNSAFTSLNMITKKEYYINPKPKTNISSPTTFIRVDPICALAINGINMISNYERVSDDSLDVNILCPLYKLFKSFTTFTDFDIVLVHKYYEGQQRTFKHLTDSNVPFYVHGYGEILSVCFYMIGILFRGWCLPCKYKDECNELRI